MVSGLTAGFLLDRQWHWLRGEMDRTKRRSKRLQDLADVQSLLEDDPDLIQELTSEERALLDKLLG